MLRDAHLVDLCHDIELSAFDSYGHARFAPLQPAGGCVVDILGGGSVSMELTTTVKQDMQFDVYIALRSRTVRPGESTYAFRSDVGGCERAVDDDHWVLETTLRPMGSVPVGVRCGATDAMLRQDLRLLRHTLPSRAIAHPSLSSLDLCHVLRAARLGRLRYFRPDAALHRGTGGKCSELADNVTLTLSNGWLRGGLPPGSAFTIGAQTVDQVAARPKHDCRVFLQRGGTTDGTREVLDADLELRVPATVGDLCPTARAAMHRVMSAGHLG